MDSVRYRMEIQTTTTSPKSAGINLDSARTTGIDFPEILSHQGTYSENPKLKIEALETATLPPLCPILEPGSGGILRGVD